MILVDIPLMKFSTDMSTSKNANETAPLILEFIANAILSKDGQVQNKKVSRCINPPSNFHL